MPQHVFNAQIIVTDANKNTLKRTTVSSSGALTVAAGSLASGTYKYSLVVNGRLIDTKTMVLTINFNTSYSNFDLVSRRYRRLTYLIVTFWRSYIDSTVMTCYK